MKRQQPVLPINRSTQQNTDILMFKDKHKQTTVKSRVFHRVMGAQKLSP